MTITKATTRDCDTVLEILRDFLLDSARMRSSTITESPIEVKKKKFFEKIIALDTTAVFLAWEDDCCVGIITAHQVPQLRHGGYYVEVEEMYVREEYQGKGIAQALMEKVFDWAKENSASSIRLQSANERLRAHAFYRKIGMQELGKAFKKYLNR